MLALFLIILFFLVSYDAKLLQRQDGKLYEQIFNGYPEKWGFYAAFLFVVVLPIYVLRRRKFKAETGRAEERTPGEYFSPATAAVSDACGIILEWFCWVVLGSVVLRVLAYGLPALEEELIRTLAISVFSSGIMTLLIYRLTRYYPGGFRRAVGLRPEGDFSFSRTVIIPILFGIGFASLSAYVLVNRSHIPQTPMTDVITGTDSSAALFGFFIVAVLIAPLLEELIFRGYFFGVIRRFKGENVAIPLVALSFGILHVPQYWGDWLAILMVVFLGFALTALRAWSGTTFASVVTHYTYNLFVIVLPVVMLVFANPAYMSYAMNPELGTAQKEQLLRQSIEENPDFAMAYNDLAWLYAQEGRNLDEALNLIDRALEHEPGNPAYLDTKAEILYQKGDRESLQEAVEVEEELVERHQGNAFFREQLEKFRHALKEKQRDGQDEGSKIIDVSGDQLVL